MLLDLYQQSPTHRSCINFGVQSIIGGGVDYEAMQLDSGDMEPSYDSTWDELIRAISLDYLIYGSYAVQVIKNRDNTTYSFYHMPLDKVRATEYDADGQITEYAISQDWTATRKVPTILYQGSGYAR